MRGRRAVWGVAIVLALGIWTAVALMAAVGRVPPDGAASFQVVRPAKAAPAPEFELADLSGQPLRLADLRGRVVVLNFWATWCPPCLAEMPALQDLARDLAPRGLVVLAVNFEESASPVAEFVRQQGLTLPVLLDARGEVGARYRLAALPATFFVDRRGDLVGTAIGIRDWAAPESRAYLADLLARS